MSVIAWDGRELATDRQATCGDVIATVAKFRRIRLLDESVVVAWCGIHERGLALANWYEAGADRAAWPDWQRDSDWVEFIVASQTGVVTYGKMPIAQPLLSPYGAWGSGREVALGVLAMGGTARMAVEIASRHVASCGRGVDVFGVR